MFLVALGAVVSTMGLWWLLIQISYETVKEEGLNRMTIGLLTFATGATLLWMGILTLVVRSAI
jgi:hypothetical protein